MLESLILEVYVTKGCSSKTCNEEVRSDMGLKSQRGRRNRIGGIISTNA